MRMQLVRLGFLALFTAVPLAAAAQTSDYIVTAQGWGAAQAEAVAAAGGTVIFGHDGSGVGVVRSSAPDFLSRIRGSHAIQSAERDVVVSWQRPQTGGTIDADFTNPPNNDTFFNGVQWAPQAIDAPAAWAEGCTGLGVRVAILDGGIRHNHPDLAPNLDTARSTSFVPGEPYNNDTGTFWHGTHVAGIVAAVDNVGTTNSGVIGIAPRATLVGVKVLHNGSGAFGWIIQGILYAATPIAQGGGGADIINMSLGAVFNKNDPDARGLVAAMNKALNYADRFGVLVVSAAGNDGIDLDHSGNVISVPAQSGSGVSVSSTGPVGFGYGATNFDSPASYTNYGNSAINVAAPGGDFQLFGTPAGNAGCVAGLIVQACWALDMVLSTTRNGWGWAAGTSMAAPAASAVAAIIKQRNPGISLGALKTSLARSALDRGKQGNDPFYGKGWVNALAACRQ
ncbi:MAG TPA: S8 family serine peptidase [Vicinamibacterales bacterium]|nr:S8 family serine peptidase [Vicinamibacterales bacterium]